MKEALIGVRFVGPAPWMQCGWGCGAWLTGHQMRAHFTRCPHRPADLPQVNYLDRPRRNWKAKPGRRRGVECCAAGVAAPDSRLAAYAPISITARGGRGFEVRAGQFVSSRKSATRGPISDHLQILIEGLGGLCRISSSPRNSAAVRGKKPRPAPTGSIKAKMVT